MQCTVEPDETCQRGVTVAGVHLFEFLALADGTRLLDHQQPGRVRPTGPEELTKSFLAGLSNSER